MRWSPQAVGQEPAHPGRAPAAAGTAPGDGVFLRLMALPKGRGMLTRALRLLYAPPLLAESVPGARPGLSRQSSWIPSQSRQWPPPAQGAPCSYRAWSVFGVLVYQAGRTEHSALP